MTAETKKIPCGITYIQTDTEPTMRFAKKRKVGGGLKPPRINTPLPPPPPAAAANFGSKLPRPHFPSPDN